MTEPTTAELVEKVANALGYEVLSNPPDGGSDVTTTVDTQPASEPEPAPPLQAWKGPLVVENAPTGDRRRIMPGALTTRDLPLPMMFQRETPQGGLGGNPHAGARAAGHIDLIWPGDDGVQWGAGVFDTGDDGQEAARMIREQTVKGLSVDLDDVDAEVVQLGVGDDTTEELQITKARIMGVTVVPFPAIPGAGVSLVDSEEFASLSAEYGQAFAANEPDADDIGSTVAKRQTMQPGGGRIDKSNSAPSGSDSHPASGTDDPAIRAPRMMSADGGPMLPPEEWFANPELAHPTPFTITDDGRVYGHAAQWGVCHIGVQGGTCVTAPHSPSGYSHFTVGAVRASCDCDDPSGQAEIPTGPITLGTDHAGGRLTAAEATMHYANTGMAVADVVAGEDEHGIWVAGALRPGLADEKIRELRAAALSGDWRRIGGNLELVGILAVNVPGFGVGRTKFHTAGQDQTALVAAGVIVGEKLTPTDALEMQARELAALRREISEIHKAVAEPVLIDQQVARLETLGAKPGDKSEHQSDPDGAPAAPNLAAELIHLTIEDGQQLRNFDTAQRKAAAKAGTAMPDGSFPIQNCGDWNNARRALGRAAPGKRAAVQAHINSRGKALGCGSGDSGS